jgi:hypothetical protein
VTRPAGGRVFVCHRARIALYVIVTALPLAVFPVGFWRFATTHDALGWSIVVTLSLGIFSSIQRPSRSLRPRPALGMRRQLEAQRLHHPE